MGWRASPGRETWDGKLEGVATEMVWVLCFVADIETGVARCCGQRDRKVSYFFQNGLKQVAGLLDQ